MTSRIPFRLSRRAWLVTSLLALGLGAAGVAVASPGWFGHGNGRGWHGSHGFGEEEIRDLVRHVLREVDASDEQVARVGDIANALAADLRAAHEAHRARRDAFEAALVGADRAALEQLRADELATADAVSQRVVAALADAADVLTPEQRARLAEHRARHGHHRWH